MNMTCLFLAAVLSTGVEIPNGGVPVWDTIRYASLLTIHLCQHPVA